MANPTQAFLSSSPNHPPLSLFTGPNADRKTYISALLTMPKPLTVWITISWKILKEMGNTRPPDLPVENLYAGQEATVRTGRGTVSK